MDDFRLVADIDQEAVFQFYAIADTLSQGPDLEDENLTIITGLLFSAILELWVNASWDDLEVIQEFLDNCSDTEKASKAKRWLEELSRPVHKVFPIWTDTKGIIEEVGREIRDRKQGTPRFGQFRTAKTGGSFACHVHFDTD
jgi:hypothetical protein